MALIRYFVLAALVACCLSLAGAALPRWAPPSPPAARSTSTSAEAKATVMARMAKLPLRFEANAGQWDERVAFVARQGGVTLFITEEGMTFALREVKAVPRAPGMSPRDEIAARRKALSEAKTATLTMKLVVGASAGAAWAKRAVLRGEKELITKSNFFLGNDKTKWRTNVPNYGQVRAKDAVPGVDVVWHGGDSGIEYDLEVAAGVDARQLAFEIDGADRAYVAEDGSLEIATAAGTLVQRPPKVVQDGRELRTRYEVRAAQGATQRVGFAIDGYDETRALLIDPSLVYSTYLGGSDGDEGDGIAVDGAGCAYVTGSVSSTNFPTANAYQGAKGGGRDAFVTKLNAAGSALVYSTYLGGSDYDFGRGIAVDGAGSAYVTGDTWSQNFPTANAYQGAFGGGNDDAFVTKLNTAGSALVYSTYLGGSGEDYGSGIAVDAAGSAYVTGDTRSQNFPTANAYQGAFGGVNDAFVTKLSAAGSALVYSTYLGGDGGDRGSGIAVDAAGNAYVTGRAGSADFPTANAYQGAFGGGDAFVTKLNAAGSGLVYSTYLGGSGDDWGYGIAVDAAGSAYVTGQTNSTNFPTANAYQGALGGGEDAFVTKLNAAGSALVYSTYLGGGADDWGNGIAVDAAGSAYVTGFTESQNFPTANAYQGAFGGGFYDAFVTKLNAAGPALVYSTYLGGSSDDGGNGIAVDAAGNAYVTGYTYSDNFPTKSPYQGAYGWLDAFVVKTTDATLALGAACTLNGECTSLHCVDGVCCNTACGGLCEACTAAKTGGADGTCAPVTSNTDPDNECAQDDPSTCGKNGLCNGAKACAKWDNSTVCAPQVCENGTQTEHKCDGSGTCVAAVQTACTPYVCGANACLTTCASDTDCVSTHYCDVATSPKVCKPKVAQGAVCAADNQCSSGHCVDGVCCDSACGGLCEACSAAKTGGVDGICAPVASNTDPDNDCAQDPPGTCGQNGLCDGAKACAKWDNTTVCALQVCTNGTQTAERKCDGAGTCVAGVQTPCTPYVCGANACLTTCASDGDCVPTHYCDLATSPTVCKPKGAQGAVCTANDQCSSGNCVDGVCCDTACAGLCEACSAAKTGGVDGTCAPVTSNTDPDDECAQDAPSTCGQTGVCNGAKACAKWDNTTACGSTCVSGTETDSYCNGKGDCLVGGSHSCNNLVCTSDGTKCKTTCADDTDCLTGFTCAQDGKCVPSAGAVCIDDHTSKAVDNTTKDCTPYKCDTSGTCVMTCASVRDCVAPYVCDANGKCVPLSAPQSSGCACGTSSNGSPPWTAAMVAALVAFVGTRMRRRRAKRG